MASTFRVIMVLFVRQNSLKGETAGKTAGAIMNMKPFFPNKPVYCQELRRIGHNYVDVLACNQIAACGYNVQC